MLELLVVVHPLQLRSIHLCMILVLRSLLNLSMAHGMFNVALVFVVQPSSSLYGLLPFVGLTNVILAGPSCVTSGPSCVCCGM